MSQLKRADRQLLSPRGQTMIEYALMLATFAVLLFALTQSAGAIVAELVNKVGPLF